MRRFIKVNADGSYGGEVSSARQDIPPAAEVGALYIAADGRADGPWAGKIYDPGTDSWAAAPKVDSAEETRRRALIAMDPATGTTLHLFEALQLLLRRERF